MTRHREIVDRVALRNAFIVWVIIGVLGLACFLGARKAHAYTHRYFYGDSVEAAR